jgi:hypothetical protein
MGTPPARPTALDAATTAAAIFGTLPVAVLGCAALARFLPCSEDSRFAIAFAALVPSWLLGMCWAFVAQSGRRAWLLCLSLALLLAAVVYGVPAR